MMPPNTASSGAKYPGGFGGLAPRPATDKRTKPNGKL